MNRSLLALVTSSLAGALWCELHGAGVQATPADTARRCASCAGTAAPSSATEPTGATPPTGVSHVFAFSELDNALQRLLAGSALFRRRYVQVVVNAGVVVRITYLFPLSGYQSIRAETRIVPCEGRPCLALVRITRRYRHNAVELIAHEFEHIAEVIEGVDHKRELRAGRGGTWKYEDGFETHRALIAGRAAAREVREYERARERHLSDWCTTAEMGGEDRVESRPARQDSGLTSRSRSCESCFTACVG